MAYFNFDGTTSDLTGVYTARLSSTSGITYITGQSGQALNFNGASYVDYNDPIIPNGPKKINFWFRCMQNTAPQTLLCTTSSFSSHGILIMVNVDGKIQVVYANGSTVPAINFVAESLERVDDNNWHHFVFDWDGKAGSDVKIKIDNDIYHAISNSAESGSHYGKLRIGRYHNASVANFFFGAIDELEIAPKKGVYLLQKDNDLYGVNANNVEKVGTIEGTNKAELFEAHGLTTLTKKQCQVIATELQKAKIIKMSV